MYSSEYLKQLLALFTLQTTSSAMVRLILLMCLVSFLELFGLSIIYPIMALILHPDKLYKSHFLHFAYVHGRFSNTNQFILMLIVVALTVFIVKYGLSIYTARKKYSHIYQGQVGLANRIMRQYLQVNYQFFARHSAVSLIERINVDLMLSFNQVLVNILVLLSDFFLLFFFIIAIGCAVPLAGYVFASLFIVGLGTFYTISRWKSSCSKATLISYADIQSNMAQIVEEAISNFKVTKTRMMEQIYIDKFSQQSQLYKSLYISFRRSQDLPKSNMELLAGLVLSVLLCVIVVFNLNVVNLIPVISVMLLAIFRLLPACNRMILCYSDAKFFMPAVRRILPIVFSGVPSCDGVASAGDERFCRVELRGIGHCYNGQHVILNDVNLSIRPGEHIYFIGETGAGKSTLLNILLGLLPPDSGAVLLNGKPIDKLYEHLSSALFYLPQDLYFPDHTLLDIVVNYSAVDNERVERCLRLACFNIDSSSFSEGVDTRVGVAGARLSGGEKQRLALARALYAQPEILVLDEATSAIDDVTQALIMNNIRQYFSSMTIISVTHRYNVIQPGDLVYEVGGGGCTKKEVLGSNQRRHDEVL